jgi:hypothetical protein
LPHKTPTLAPGAVGAGASIAKISHNEQSGGPDCIFSRHANLEQEQAYD